TAPREDGVVLTVDTDEGAPATVTLAWLTPRTLEVTMEPPEPVALVAVGDRWRSPRSEAIYGLTERLRDSPPIADGVVDIPTDDAKPPQVGSLDRRGETVAMYVRPTFSLYAPFYQSSRGYGLAVAGTTVGLFDGVAMNAEVVDDVTMYEALGIPPGVYHFDRPVLVGEYGFARWAWDETRLPNPDAMLAALRRRGYRIMTWSATWQCGAEPGDNALEAQGLGFLAPGPAAPP